MAMKGLDGFFGRIRGVVRSTDDTVTVSANAYARLNTVASGDYTYLLLEDEVVGEVVRWRGGAQITQDRRGVIIPLERGISGTRYNLGPRPILRYGFCTQIVEDTVSQMLAKGSST